MSAGNPSPDVALTLEIKGLRLAMPTFEGTARILKGVDLEIAPGDVLGLVGETGCGKTMTALAALRLLDSPPAQIEAQKIFFGGRDLFHMPSEALRKVRASQVAMLFQDPETNLNPVLTVGSQMIDAILCRRGFGTNLVLSPLGHCLPAPRRYRREAMEVALDLLFRVGMTDPKRVLAAYPSELSGGMKQRVLIAMALGGNPELLVADEPTTALDVSIQAQILDLVRGLVSKMGLSVLWITHNLGVVAHLCNYVAVMYAGTVVEYASVREIFRSPQHPYTMRLLDSVPTRSKRGQALRATPGTIPSVVNPPAGCLFSPRCPDALPCCSQDEPALIEISRGRRVRCHRHTGATPDSPPEHRGGKGGT